MKTKLIWTLFFITAIGLQGAFCTYKLVDSASAGINLNK